VFEDLLAWAPGIYDEEEFIHMSGDDGVVRTMTVMPELFQEGTVNIVPDAESMLPEGRGERQEIDEETEDDRRYEGGAGRPEGLDQRVRLFRCSVA
jgi:hypothetical protein